MNQKIAKRIRATVLETSPFPLITKKEFMKIPYPDPDQKKKHAKYQNAYKEFKRKYVVLSGKEKVEFWSRADV